MFNFIFNVAKKDVIDISVDVDAKTVDDLRKKANKDAEEEANKKLRNHIISALKKQYKVDINVHWSPYSMYLDDRFLLVAIIDEMVVSLNEKSNE